MAPPVHVNLTAFVVDVGEHSKGPYLDKAKQIMINMVKRMMFITPNDEMAIICYGSSLNWDSIDVQPFQSPDWDLIKTIESLESTEQTGHAFEEALSTAFEMVKTYINDNHSGIKYDSVRVWYLHNCFENVVDRKYDFEVIKKKPEGVELWCISEKSWPEMLKEKETSSSHKERIDFLEQVNDKYVAVDEMIEETTFVGSKLVKVIPSNVDLSLSSITIPIAIYKMIENENLKPEMSANCEKTTTYLDRNKEVIHPSSTIRAYKFGHSLIPVTEEDEQRMKINGEEKGLKIMGFVNKDEVSFHHWGVSPARLVLPFKNSLPQQSSDYYSLHESMHRQNVVALVKGLLRSTTDAPKIGLLYPEIDEKSSMKGFVFLDTPYEEQQYALLFKQIPKSFEIEQEISQSVRDLIENSSLYNPEEDKHYLAPGTVPNPAPQVYWDAIAFKILNQDEQLNEMVNPRVLDVLKQPQFVVDKSKESVEKLRRVFQKYVKTQERVEKEESQTKSEDVEKTKTGVQKNKSVENETEQYFDDEDSVMDF